jgi:hypothetical protein
MHWIKPVKPASHMPGSCISHGGWQLLHKMMQHYEIEITRQYQNAQNLSLHVQCFWLEVFLVLVH